MKITHLSVIVNDPKQAATVLAELTNGEVSEFGSRVMQGAYVCMWGSDKDELIEFIPNGYVMYPTTCGADFKKTDEMLSYNSTHFQLRVNLPLENMSKIAKKYNCQQFLRTSKSRGGPLLEIWIEKFLLVEFTSEEIDKLETI